MNFKKVKMKSTNPIGNMSSADLSRLGIIEHNEIIVPDKIYEVPKNLVRQLINAGFVIVEEKTPKKSKKKGNKTEDK